MAAEGERESQAGQRVPGISRGLLREEASVTGGFELMDTQKRLVTVARMATPLGVFRSGSYRWRWARGHSRPGGRHTDGWTSGCAVSTRTRIRTYGYPRVSAQLAREGVRVDRKTVAAMRRLGIEGVSPHR